VIQPGDTVYVDPARAPIVGREVCIRFHDGAGVITRLMGFDDDVVPTESWAKVAARYKAEAIEAIHAVRFHLVGYDHHVAGAS
jgi:hypothetical protein